jgi:formylglycine-generating enzyme required for sulfatase activity
MSRQFAMIVRAALMCGRSAAVVICMCLQTGCRDHKSEGGSDDRSRYLATPPALTSSGVERGWWDGVIAHMPDPSVVHDSSIRDAIIRSGLPWRVRGGGGSLEFVLIPPGQFVRGIDDLTRGRAGGPKHTVRITTAFYMSTTEVTNAQFRVDTEHHSGPIVFDATSDPSQPVVMVTWGEARAFARRHSCDLPTEAEWEFACRGGGKFDSWWDEPSQGRTFANLRDQSAQKAFHGYSSLRYEDGFPIQAPVGRFRPNGFGLYDMIGNVSEWCLDWYSETAYQDCAPQAVDPTGPLVGEDKVHRGGSALEEPVACNCGWRALARPSARYPTLGFRVCHRLER